MRFTIRLYIQQQFRFCIGYLSLLQRYSLLSKLMILLCSKAIHTGYNYKALCVWFSSSVTVFSPTLSASRYLNILGSRLLILIDFSCYAYCIKLIDQKPKS